MSDGVARRREDADALGDLAVAVDGYVRDPREVDPVADGRALRAGCLELRALRHDRDPGERAVLPAVIEVEVCVDDRTDLVGIEARRGERVADRATDRPIVLVDPVVAFADPGVDKEDARRMSDREPEDDAGLSGKRMLRWIGDVREMQRNDVFGRHHGRHLRPKCRARYRWRDSGISHERERLRSTYMRPHRTPSRVAIWT